ncbi:hypothetical protein [Aurantimonas sp. VKM B-3413]|uniref:hypothetical protein n=1 Tax=Aurantimonas sp. VKM B-3413 TaxID=2779401 RepID=UPI001E51C056|nr:hypothetical protein [Aurantimonas sp. VKM B-3413]MCB8837812.1 hypothetical protein [Aurantimonas sp. VKM B-3413]
MAEELPGSAFLALGRTCEGQPAEELRADSRLGARAEDQHARLVENGAAPSSILFDLVTHLEADRSGALVINMLEEGLDQASQKALIADLRRRGPDAGSLFFTTRSSSILDLASVGGGEAIILCPANHSPPMLVAPYPGTPGYEAVALCLADPQVRERTRGVTAVRRKVA